MAYRNSDNLNVFFWLLGQRAPFAQEVMKVLHASHLHNEIPCLSQCLCSN